MDINKIFPVRSFFQGDTWKLNLILDDYNAEEWTLTYTFRKQGSTAFSISSVAAADGSFYIHSPAATTTNYVPGNYYVVATVTSQEGERFTLGQIEMVIKPDISKLPSGDPRSVARKALDDIEAALAAGAGSDVVEYTVGPTTVKKDRAGLLELRAFYLLRVRMEEGRPSIGTIQYLL